MNTYFKNDLRFDIFTKIIWVSYNINKRKDFSFWSYWVLTENAIGSNEWYDE